jgi:hypothetical protein
MSNAFAGAIAFLPRPAVPNGREGFNGRTVPIT